LPFSTSHTAQDVHFGCTVNFRTLPDFIAISMLVGIFFSLLRRSPQTRLRYLFVGWLLILGHFVSMFLSSQSPKPVPTLDFIGLATLLLASVAFVWAARAWEGDSSQKSRRMLLAASPSFIYLACAQNSGTPFAVFDALCAAGFVLTLLAAELERRRDYRALDVAAIVVAYAGEAALLHLASVEAAVAWLLGCAFFTAAITFWRNAEKITTGTVTTTGAFLLWGLVFPIGELLDYMAPSLHVDPEVWNLPKFLVASGMILALLEDQLRRNEQLALEDDLTGLPNRRLYEDRFAQSLSQARRSGHRVAYFSIDVDDFKEINDTRGHVAGDEVLRHLASRFGSALRDTDTLARTGGDEFGVIVSGVPDRATAQAIAEALHESLVAPLIVGDEPLTATVSVGLALYPDDATEAVALKSFADREMYREKRGRSVRGDLAAR
jgi:diguanylate cyclase (GGDEF)-like protein